MITGLAAEVTPLKARIVTMSDSDGPLCNLRPFRSGLPMEAVERDFRKSR